MRHQIYKATTHTSYVLSQVCGVLRDYISEKFPTKFFKDFVVGTEDFHVREQRRLQEGRSKEFMRRVPVLAIKPIYNAEATIFDDPYAEEWKHLGKRLGMLSYLEGKYPAVFDDQANDVKIFMLPKKYKINLEFKLRVSSELEMWDTLSMLKNNTIFGSYFYLNQTNLQVVIPPVIVAAAAANYDLDLRLRTDRNTLQNVLQSKSNANIFEEVNPARGISQFMFDFAPNLLVKLEFPSGEKVKRGKSNFTSEISFSGEVLLSIPTNFVTQTIDIDDDIALVVEDIRNASSEPIIRLDRIFKPPHLELETGEKIIFYKSFITDAPNQSEVSILHNKLGLELSPCNITETQDEFDGGLQENLFISSLDHPDSEIIASEDETVVDVTDIHTQKISASKGFTVYTNTFPIERSTKYKIQLRFTSNIDDPEFLVRFSHMRSKISKVTLNKSNFFMTAELVLETGNAKDLERLFITYQSTEPIEVWFSEISVKKIESHQLSTETEDYLYLNDYLDDKIKAVIEYNKNNDIDNDSVFKFKVYQVAVGEVDSSDIEMDWDEMRLIISNPYFKTKHSLAIYADMNAFDVASQS